MVQKAKRSATFSSRILSSVQQTCLSASLLFFLWMLTGCGLISNWVQQGGKSAVTSISGSVLPMTNGTFAMAGTNAQTTLTCNTATASLFRLSSTGAILQPELTSVALNADGTYTFSNLASVGVQFEGREVIGNYLVKVAGCSSTYSRIITGSKQQDVSFGSSLVGFLLNTPHATNLANANRAQVNQVMAAVAGYNDYPSAYSALTANSSLAQSFYAVFGVTPNILLDATPTLLNILVPTEFNEGQTSAMSISVTQWNPTYQYAYLWELDGSVISTSNNVTFTPSANSQGQHVVSVFYGKKDGNGDLDLSQPFTSKSYTVTIANDIPPTPPSLSVVGPATINTTSVSLQIATGAALSQCASFSGLAITEDSAVAPTTSSAFNIACTQAPTQNITYNLLTGPGSKTLRLWAIDAAGNISSVSQSVAVVYSQSMPVVVISSPISTNPVGTSLTVAGSCDSSAGDVTLTGGLVSAPVVTACTGSAFSQFITLTSPDGTKTITASQTNSFSITGSDSRTWTRDMTAPTAVISSTATDPTNAASFVIDVTFSESVTGFDQTKLVVSNGSVSAFAGSGSSYTFTFTPTSVGAVTVDIAAGAGVDIAGNASLAATTFSRQFDNSQPSVTLGTTAPNPSNTTPIPVTVTFSEAVTGFTASGLTLVNATVSGFAGSGTTYSFNLVPSGQGTVSATVNAAVAQDTAGNNNTASATLSRTFDSVRPTLTLSTTASEPTNVSPIPVTATFSEAVTGFTSGAVVVTNGAVSGFSGSGTTYTFNVTPTGNNVVTINVAAGVAQDAAGNTNTIATTLTRTFNSAQPSVVVSSTVTSPTNLATYPITVTFSVSVTGFVSGDVSVTNGVLTGFSGSGTTYTFDIAPSGQGDVTISVASGVAQDGAANVNLASNPLVINYDSVAPTLAVTAPTGGAYVNLSNVAALTVTGTCSENGRSVSLAVGAVSTTASCTSGAFTTTMDLQSLSDGALTLVADLSDAAGNAATAVNVSLIKDISVPTATLTGVPATPSAVTTLNVTVGGSGVTHYMHKVGGASSTDCSQSSGYSSDTVIATHITNSISAVADGAVKICVVGRGVAGNYQTYATATTNTWTKDTVVTAYSGLALSPGATGNNNKPTITGTSEGLAVIDMYTLPGCTGSVIANGTAAANGTFSVTPGSSIGADGVYSFSAMATDLAGNTLCSNALAYTLDTVQATVTVASTSSTPTATSPFPVTAVFSKSVTGFTTSGLTVTNGTVSAFTGSGTSYSFNVTPSGQGAVTIAVNAAAGTDSSGNANLVSNTLSLTYDTVAPTLTIASPANNSSTNQSAITVSGACETGISIVVSGTGVTSPASITCTGSAYSASLTLSASDGVKNMALAQTDGAGNSTSVSLAVTKDTVAPTLTFASGAVQTQLTTGNTATFSGACETGLTITVAGGTDSTTATCTGSAWTYTTVSRNSDATRTYTFTQTDAGGNATTITGTWQRDTTAPALTLTSPAANFADAVGVTLTGACENGLSIPISGTGVLSSFSSTCNSGTYSQYVYFSASDGTKAITLSQTDAVGNVTSISRNFVRDTTPPALTQTAHASPYSTNTNTASFGGACETGLTIVVSGSDSSTATCTASAWTYTTASQTTDASRSYTFTQTDSSANPSAITVTWVRDTVAPVMAFTSASSYSTSTNSVTFAGSCETGVTVNITGSATTTTACSGGLWSYSTNSSSDGTYTYNFAQTDAAGNTGTAIVGTWTRNTTGPTITMTQTSPITNSASSLALSGTCSGSSVTTVNITGAVTTSVSCSAGAWSYNATQSTDASYTYTFTVTDSFALSSSVSMIWKRDTTAPVLTAGGLTINGGTGTTTSLSFNPLSFLATDNLTTVASFCVKTVNSAPTASDSCWYPVNGSLTNVTPSNSVSISGYQIYVGIVPTTTYSVYVWVMDGAGNISTQTSTTSKDMVTITYNPVAPPSVATVLVGNSDTMNGVISERTISAGSTVYVRWTASGSSLGSTPVKLYFTTDDATWTLITSGLGNDINNCTSITGSGTASTTATGCYMWTNGSPSSSYYRIRVSLTNTSGGTTFANSSPINTPALQVLAGNTETGLNGAALSAVFQSRIATTSDTPSLAVKSDGTIYYRDAVNGIVYISPSDGLVRQLIPFGAATPGYGDGGPVTAAKLTTAQSMVMDYQERLIVMDANLIRRIDLSQSPPTITTIIGGGSNIAANKTDTVSNPLNLYISGSSTHLKVLPNGDIYFMSETWTTAGAGRLRHYVAATNSITSIYPTGPGSGSPLAYNGGVTITNVSGCFFNDLNIAFDTVSSSISTMLVASGGPSPCAATGSAGWYFYRMDSTGANSTIVPDASGNTYANVTATFYTKNIDAHDGNIYTNVVGGIYKYNLAANTWSAVVGTGTSGSCADGTAPTSCQVFAQAGYVDPSGTLYFMDRGRIRVVTNNTVVTVAGQSLSFGDSGLATNSRLGLVTGVLQKTANSSFNIMDQTNSRIRNFARNGTISTLAGTDTNAAPDYVTAATAQPIQGSNMFAMDSADTVYLPTNSAQRLISLTSAVSAVWAQFSGFGATNYASANGIAASGIAAFGCCTVQPLGYNGTSLLYANLNVIAEINLTTGINNIALGPVTSGTNFICASGTALGSCAVYTSASPNVMAAWDTVNSKWLVLNSDRLTLLSFARGDSTITTATTLPRTARSIQFLAVASTRYLYYCSSTGFIYLRNLGTGTEVQLPWPVSSISCQGNTLAYDATAHSLIFPFKQNGLYGVGELLNVDPSLNGM